MHLHPKTLVKSLAGYVFKHNHHLQQEYWKNVYRLEAYRVLLLSQLSSIQQNNISTLSWLSILRSMIHAQLSCSKTVWSSTIFTRARPGSQVPCLQVVPIQILPTELMASLHHAVDRSHIK